MIVYKIQNKINAKIYIGITKKDINARIMKHLVNDSYIGNAIRKYGLQCFDTSVIDTSDDWSTLCEKEKEYIKFYNSKFPNGYNLTDGGDGVSNLPDFIETKRRNKISNFQKGRIHPDEQNRKISKALKGKKLSEEHKRKLSESHQYQYGEKNSFFGKKHTEESKQKIRDKRKLQVFTEETRKKLSESRKGKKHSEETKQKISKSKKGKSNAHNIGVPLSKEHKQKISEANKGHTVTEATREKLRQANLGKRYSKEVNKKKGIKNEK